MPWVSVTYEAVTSRWRELTPGEMSIVTQLIADAQDELEEALEARGIFEAQPGERWARAYVRTVATMVKRVLQNPEGFLSTAFTIDDYREEYRRDSAVSAGALYVSDSELDGLVPNARRRRGAFSVVLGRS